MQTSHHSNQIDQECQIHSVGRMGFRLPILGIVWQRRNRIRRIINRRWSFLMNVFSRIIGNRKSVKSTIPSSSPGPRIKQGDLVMVKSRKEIEATLGDWNSLKGCSFMEEMWPYCRTKQKVFKRVERFLDERDYLIKKTKGLVLLEGIYCKGTKDFGPCDRSCFYFWREEWLEKIEEAK